MVNVRETGSVTVSVSGPLPLAAHTAPLPPPMHCQVAVARSRLLPGVLANTAIEFAVAAPLFDSVPRYVKTLP